MKLIEGNKYLLTTFVVEKVLCVYCGTSFNPLTGNIELHFMFQIIGSPISSTSPGNIVLIEPTE